MKCNVDNSTVIHTLSTRFPPNYQHGKPLNHKGLKRFFTVSTLLLLLLRKYITIYIYNKHSRQKVTSDNRNV
ncbi:putative non-structural protein [Microviridae phi-CA82]|uniref:putative non-structural protein n=1 Tax=Microviridae phi-CA82 TaxID=913970 RepID=UPI000215DF83|nr:putative non-structural protein [Microviridae phi-CA82]ADP89810.1 putative non-structural protein [Microviridae phi-CA82]